MAGVARHFALAHHYLDVERPEAALQALDKVGDEGLELPEYWWIRSASLLNLEREREAADAAERGLAIDAQDAQLLFVLALAKGRQGHLAAGEQVILRALHLHPENPALLCAYAQLVARGGQFDKADRLVARAAALDPDDGEVARTRFIIANLRGDDKQAGRHGNAWIAADPDEASAHGAMGLHLLDRGDVRQARARVAAAARLDPDVVARVPAFREVRVASHWTMLPLRPIARYGPAKVWVAAVVVLLVVAPRMPPLVSNGIIIFWLAYVAYSWIAPPLVRWAMRRGWL